MSLFNFISIFSFNKNDNMNGIPFSGNSLKKTKKILIKKPTAYDTWIQADSIKDKTINKKKSMTSYFENISTCLRRLNKMLFRHTSGLAIKKFLLFVLSFLSCKTAVYHYVCRLATKMGMLSFICFHSVLLRW